ncbi:MAG: cytochrome P450 [Gammaproteobacteria bacterium]|nr:cytochrome P450 [Gammaproteobacteria bacterium]
MSPPDDLLSPDAIRDPQGFFRQLRETDPVFWSKRHKVWILTGYEDVERLFQNRSLSTAQGIGTFRSRMMAEHAQLLKHAMSLLDGWMLFNDPPVHTRLRDPVRRSFSPAMVDRLVPRIERHVTTLLDSLQDSQAIDLVSRFAQPLTAMVICDLLGLDLSEREFLRSWARDFGKLIYGASSRDPNYLSSVARAGDQFHERFQRTIAEKRASPGEDLLSRLLTASTDEQWTESELIGACSMLLFAGHDTTSALLGSGVRNLLLNPASVTELKVDPSLMPGAVEELLRFDSPSKTFIRVPVTPMQVGGHDIAAGQHLWLGILAADHDPAVFADPERLDIHRSPNPHIAFGAGIHFCLGSALARAEARAAFTSLFERFPKLRLTDHEPRWSPTIVDRSLLELPVLLN